MTVFECNLPPQFKLSVNRFAVGGWRFTWLCFVVTWLPYTLTEFAARMVSVSIELAEENGEVTRTKPQRK